MMSRIIEVNSLESLALTVMTGDIEEMISLIVKNFAKLIRLTIYDSVSALA